MGQEHMGIISRGGGLPISVRFRAAFRPLRADSFLSLLPSPCLCLRVCVYQIGPPSTWQLLSWAGNMSMLI